MSIEVSQCNPQERKHSGHFVPSIWGVNSSSKILREIPGMNHCWTKKMADEFRMNSGLAEYLMYDTVVEILQFDRYSFFHYGSLSQVLMIALYNGENGFWGPKPWMINLEWSFSSSLRGPSLRRELQGARHAVSLMAESHTELLRLLLEQSRWFPVLITPNVNNNGSICSEFTVEHS